MTNEQRSDVSLVRQILSGDEKAFDALYKRHKQRIHRYIFKKIGDWHYAEELTDDTFLKAKEHLKTVREPEKVFELDVPPRQPTYRGLAPKTQKAQYHAIRH